MRRSGRKSSQYRSKGWPITTFGKKEVDFGCSKGYWLSIKKDKENKTTWDNKAKSHNSLFNISQLQILTQAFKKNKYHKSR